MQIEASGKIESFAAVLITQGDYKFYSAALPIEALASTCFVTTRDEDPDVGFQRMLDVKRAKEIAYYIDIEKGTIPTSVILSAQQDAQFTYDSTKKTIKFKSIPNAFLVLDGQHRVYGFRLAETNIRVPVIIYAGLNRLQESRLFIDINTKQKSVPNELLLDIKKLADYETEIELYSGNLFDLFTNSSSSALKNLMSPSKRVAGQVSRVTFYRALKPILPRIMENPEKKIFPVLNAYLQAVVWGCKDKKIPDAVTSPIVLGAFIMLFPELAAAIADKHDKDYTADRFSDVLRPIFEGIRIARLRAPGNSARQLSEEMAKFFRGQKLRL